MINLKPSNTTKEEYIYANVISSKPYRRDYVGKWLIYANLLDIDKAWEIIRKANDNGSLGVTAKTSTMKPSL